MCSLIKCTQYKDGTTIMEKRKGTEMGRTCRRAVPWWQWEKPAINKIIQRVVIIKSEFRSALVKMKKNKAAESDMTGVEK